MGHHGFRKEGRAFAQAVALAGTLEKTLVEVFEYPGYVVTRAVVPFVNEAIHIVMEGVVSAEGGGHTQRSELMPSWSSRLTPAQIDDVVAFVVQLRYMNPSVPSATLAVFMAAPEGTSVEGRALFVHHCVACHGSEGKGDGPFAASLLATSKATVPNLTDSTYFKGRKDKDLFATISPGGGHFKKAVQMP